MSLAAMRIPEVQDYGTDQAEVWLVRLRRFGRVAGFALDLGHSLFMVGFSAMAGAAIGMLIAQRWSPNVFWWGVVAGGSLGIVVGIWWAKRVFFSGPSELAVAGPERVPLSPGAYRWPGVEEAFSRMRMRGLLLALLMGAALLAIAYVGEAGKRGWPLPVPLTAIQADLILLGFILALAALLALNSRCPKCRRFMWIAAHRRQCPHCSVVLRSYLP
jgi:hypothetical protein